jgi:RNA:NAD 2'-phosphotransferase (TPT1/KptA family)
MIAGVFSSTSKFLSLMFRHYPKAIDKTLDEDGWLDTDK